MKPIELNEDQRRKIEDMFSGLFSEYLNIKSIPRYYPNITVWLSAGDWHNFSWLELCLYHLLPKIAEEHGKQPFTTPNWSEHMIRQKIINELPQVNPVDILYDIWKHPEKYAPEL